MSTYAEKTGLAIDMELTINAHFLAAFRIRFMCIRLIDYWRKSAIELHYCWKRQLETAAASQQPTERYGCSRKAACRE